MRLLVVAPSAYLVSGLAIWLQYLLPGLRTRGWKVTLGLVAGPRYHKPDAYLGRYPDPNSTIIHCSCSTDYGRLKSVRKAIRRVRPDVLLSVNIPHAILAGFEEKGRGRLLRVVMSSHGIQEDLFSDARLLGNGLDGIVCTTALGAALTRHLTKIDPARIFHSRCGVNVTERLPSKMRASALRIGYCGRIDQQEKRVFELISIATVLKQSDLNFTVSIAGSGPDEEEFWQRVALADLDQHFERLGFVPPETISTQFYSRIDCLLILSPAETGPIVAWEAMANGIPVVSSKYVSSHAEGILVDEENCLLFEVGDVYSAAKQLRRILDVDVCTKIREHAFVTAARYLSHECSIDSWQTSLTQICHLPIVKRDLTLPTFPSSGRLDAYVGPKVSGILRRMVGRLPPDSGPGGEWPHTLSAREAIVENFMAYALRMDTNLALVNDSSRQ